MDSGNRRGGPLRDGTERRAGFPGTPLDRRGFFRRAGVYAGAAALAPSLQGLIACVEEGARPRRGDGAGERTQGRAGTGPGYGELLPAGPELALPAGFRYVKLGVEGSRMSDGRLTPRAHDGMAAFPLPNGHVRLIRNHEDRDTPRRATLRGDPARAYDPRGGGGTTSLEIRVDEEGAAAPVLVRDFLSLSGTIVNCAGGPTPWRSWLSCEESAAGPGHGWDRAHGYVFEIPVSAEQEVAAVPLKALGRFVHEAVAVDPDSGIVYETEDQGRAGFYRFLPDRPGDLRAGGHLEMLAVKGQPQARLSRGQTVGELLPVEWVPIKDPDPADAERHPDSVFRQGLARGAARFSRLEGCWHGDGSVFFHSTNGGDARAGQVWQYLPGRQALTLAFESPSRRVLDSPDNITVSPRGGILICEDAFGTSHLRGLTPSGRIFDFARNRLNRREFAGATFSPGGRVLFVNIQGDTRSWGPGNPGMTLAIWGPWEEGPL